MSAGKLWRHKLASIGLVVFLALLIAGAIAPYLIPRSVVSNVQFAAKLAPPDADHWFGTDDYGRDLFSMVLLAANLDLSAAIAILVAAAAIGVILGALAGFVRWLDQPLMRLTDIFLSIPNLVLAMA